MTWALLAYFKAEVTGVFTSREMFKLELTAPVQESVKKRLALSPKGLHDFGPLAGCNAEATGRFHSRGLCKLEFTGLWPLEPILNQKLLDF